MLARATVAAALLIVGCASRAIPPAPPIPARSPGRSEAEIRAERLRTAEARAVDGWEHGVSAVAANACHALDAGVATRAVELRRIAARALLAEDRALEALALLGEATDDEALRLRVRALELAEDWTSAAALAATAGAAVDADHARYLARLAAATPGSLWRASGASCARTPLDPAATAPVIRLALDAMDAVALVAIDAPYSLVRADAANVSGFTTLRVGDVTIEQVPLEPADLSAWSARASTPVDIVLGQDVLLRWGFGLVAGELWLHPRPQRRWTLDSGEPFFRIDGVVPAVEASLEWSTTSGTTYTRTNLGLLLVDVGADALELSALGRTRIGDAIDAAEPAPEEAVGLTVDGGVITDDPLTASAEWNDAGAPPAPGCIGRIGLATEILVFRGALQLGFILHLGECTPDAEPWEVWLPFEHEPLACGVL